MLSLRAWLYVLRLLIKHRGNAYAVRDEAVALAALSKLHLVGGVENAAMLQAIRERSCKP